MIEDEPWPAGWTRPRWGGRLFSLLLGVPGAVLMLSAAVLVASGDDDGPGPALAAFAFGLGLLGPAAGSWPATRRDARLVELTGTGPPEWGLVFAYSTGRLLGMGAGLAGFVVLGTLIALASDDVMGAVIGWGLAAMLLPFAALAVVNAFGRRVVLTPTHLVIERGSTRTRVPWNAVLAVYAIEMAANNSRTRYIGLIVSDPAVVEGTGRLHRRLMRSRRLGADVAIITTCLAVAPGVLFATIERFHRDPAAREALVEVT
ncbi:hypothetical protein [Actinomycetospora aeridis]|uniref:Uncharacterized protein n=1 Tax=Actinomycetospora aeridis TaxID=3129231 RepID=A0ABU8N8U6_9PSEU